MTGPASLSDYPHLATGKVRELYRVDDELLLIVASDRVSAYDHVLPTPIPDKGRVLTAMSAFWFELLADVVPNHLVSLDDPRIPAEVAGRAMLVRSLRMLPVECVARGYLSGSGWAEYRAGGAVCGVSLPAGLVESDALPEPIFTPATKAEQGHHDENVTLAQIARTIGDDAAAAVRDLTLAVYRVAAAHVASRGMLLADTKLEFGLAPDGGDGAGGASAGPGGNAHPAGDHADVGSGGGSGAAAASGGIRLVLGDEVLTPDSSRYWPADGYAPGGPQPSFDKQYLRDWLTSPASRWDRASDAPPPPLPADVVAATRDRYIQAYERVSGRSFADWPGGA